MAPGWRHNNAWSDRRALWQINEFCSRGEITLESFKQSTGHDGAPFTK